MARRFLILAALSGMLLVILGAFGAHALEANLPATHMTWWHKAVHYQGLHTLALLAVGLIGVLSVRRKKKTKRSPAKHKTPQTVSQDRNRAFIQLNKEYLNLQYKITQHKFSGDIPPDALIEEITNIERKVRLISRALE
jgi:arginine exporter protein ArgO